MNQRIKVGDVYLQIPEGSGAGIDLAPKAMAVKAEKPETPEPLEEPQYIYRPNDPFQASIDEARAIASIGTSHKPWVKKTWFVIFIIGPLVYGELYALSLALREQGPESWQAFVGANALILPVWLVYYSIWRRKVKK